jgi:predicted dehydrogenase
MDKDVDIVYIATVHTEHHKNTLLALELGKHVLCEKPLAPNSDQAEDMIKKAREKQLFLMEAMWTRFFPINLRIKKMAKEGELGRIRLVTADFGAASKEDPNSRVYDPALAGGSLLDIGIYPIAYAYMIYGMEPSFVHASAIKAGTGVDSSMACFFTYPDGGAASLFSSVMTDTTKNATIFADDASVLINRFWAPKKAVICRKGQADEDLVDNITTEGFEYEIKAVMEDIWEGKTENSHMPLDESLSIIRTMDKLRKQCGITYPFEEKVI